MSFRYHPYPALGGAVIESTKTNLYNYCEYLQDKEARMKVLGIVASCRKLGNTEILVKEALMAAEEKGAEVDIMRWNDYNILPCEGDAQCLFGTKVCKHKDKDDFDLMLNKLYQYDGVILGAPCYFLEVQAIIKQFIDRLFILFSQPSQMAGKPAASA